MKAYIKSTCIPALILNLVTRRRWAANIIHRSLHPREEPRYPWNRKIRELQIWYGENISSPCQDSNTWPSRLVLVVTPTTISRLPVTVLQTVQILWGNFIRGCLRAGTSTLRCYADVSEQRTASNFRVLQLKKTAVIWSYETSITVYQLTRCTIPECFDRHKESCFCSTFP